MAELDRPRFSVGRRGDLGPGAPSGRLPRIFRGLLVLSTVLYLIGYWLPHFDATLYAPNVAGLRAWDGFGARIRLTPLGELTFMAVELAIPILMFFYVPGARGAFLVLTLVAILTQLGWGVRVTTPLEAFMSTLVGVAHGAILALAYATPLAARFERPKPGVSLAPAPPDLAQNVAPAQPAERPAAGPAEDAPGRQVFIASHPTEAHLVKGLLEAGGIAAVVRGEALFGLRGGLPFAADTAPSVWIVDERARAAAQEIIAEYMGNQSSRSADAPGWDCRTCAEPQEPQFTECWRCGTSRTE